MVRSFVSLCAAAAVAGLPMVARAADAQTVTTPIVVQAAAPVARTISLTTSAHVDYAPDLALLSLGVRSQGATAARAASATNEIGAKLLAALEALGIEKRDIQTTSYDVEYTEPVAPVYGLHLRERIVVQPAQPGFYTATTAVSVKAPVAKAGDAIDAAIRAGANSSYALSFASSHLDDFYAQALASAMQSARTRAAVLASAGGVAIDALQSVTTSGAPSSDAAPAPQMEARAASFAKSAPIVSGTQSVDASVDVVYSIK